MAVSCDPNDLAALAKCFKCLSAGTLEEVQTYLLCQILSAGGTGGGVPALPNGQIFVGNAANVATPVAMSKDATISNTGALTLSNNATARSDIGLGTTDTPQFARLGVGQAADAVVPLAVTRAGPGDVEVALLQTTAGGNPFLNLASVAGGGLVYYRNALNQLWIGVQAAAGLVQIDAAGNLHADGHVEATSGFINNGNVGITQVFDTGTGNTQITFNGGIAILIA